MKAIKPHHFIVKEVSIEPGPTMKQEAISSFLVKCGFCSSKFPTSELCRGAEVNPDSRIVFECDSDRQIWFKITRVISATQVAQIEAGSRFTCKEEEGLIIITAKGTKIPGEWTIKCLPKEINQVPTGTAPQQSAPPTIAKRNETKVYGEPTDSTLVTSGRQTAVVSVSKVKVFENQPRKYFDRQSLDALKKSILEIGQLQPCSVRKLQPEEIIPGEGFEYELIDGERRWRSIQLAGLAEVEVIIETRILTRAEQFAISITMNFNKEEHTLGEIVDGLAIMYGDGLTQDQIARRLCKSVTWVNHHLCLRQLHPELKALLDPPVAEDDRLRFDHARQLVKLQSQDQQLRVYQDAREQSKNPKVLSKILQKIINHHEDRKPTRNRRNKVRSLTRFNERADAEILALEHESQDIVDDLRHTRTVEFKDTLLTQLRQIGKRYIEVADTIDKQYNQHVLHGNGGPRTIQPTKENDVPHLSI